MYWEWLLQSQVGCRLACSLSSYVLLVLLELRDRSLGVSQWDWPNGWELDFNNGERNALVLVDGIKSSLAPSTEKGRYGVCS